MAHRFSLPLPSSASRAELAFTDRSDGDLGAGTDPEGRERRARALVDLPWSWVRQVHGPDVVVVDRPGGGSGTDGDGLVTAVPGAVISVRGADCPVVALVATSGEDVIGVAHAGWRGLLAGVLEGTVAAMRHRGAVDVAGFLGPCITAAHYEFGAADLDAVAARYGASVVGRTLDGRPALDLVAAVSVALGGVGVALDTRFHRCTAADDRFFSHRARKERGRHAVAAWLAPPGSPNS